VGALLLTQADNSAANDELFIVFLSSADSKES
jgi:hypothetical protein